MQSKEDRLIQRAFRMSNRTKDNFPYCASMRFNRYYLCKVFQKLGYTVGAEVGVRRGRYSKALCEANPELKLFCVDPWEECQEGKYTTEKQNKLYDYAVDNLKDCNVTIIRKRSLDAVDDFKDGELDFVFIDGDHKFDAVMQDIIRWRPKVRVGGVVAVHDYYLGEVGVFHAVEAYVRSHNIRPYYMTKECMPTGYWVNR